MAAVEIQSDPSVYLVRADDDESAEAFQDFIDEYVPEPLMFNGALAVEANYIENLAGGLLSEGFDVSLDGRPLALGGWAVAQSIPRPKWDVTEYKARGTRARVRCMTCGWQSEWERNIGLHIAQVKADHRFSVHDTRRGPRQRMVGHESKRQHKQATARE